MGSSKFNKKFCLVFGCLVVLLCPTISDKAQGQNPSNGIQISGVYGALKSADIDLVSGKVRLHESLMSVPGYVMAVQYSSLGVEKEASTRNLESATSVLGLGWSFQRNRIIRNHQGTGATADDRYMLHLNGVNGYLVFLDSNKKEKCKEYRVPSQFNWLARYYWLRDQWEITDDHGVAFVFGDDQTNGRTNKNRTENLVVWGNWLGSSVISTGQVEMTSVWNLGIQRGVTGQEVAYFYDQVAEQVGDSGKQFCKESYLSRVLGFDGSEILFEYGDKSADEYVDPHQAKNPNSKNDKDAYQERIERKFLKRIRQKNIHGETMYSAQFEYDFLNTNAPKYKKRVLRRVEYLNGSNSPTKPPLVLDYCGRNSSDPVGLISTSSEEFTLFDSASGSLFGALKAKLTPEGAMYTYHYGENRIWGSQREIDLMFPRPLRYMAYTSDTQTTHWNAPELFFGTDYLVALYEPIALDCRKTHLQVYTWIGDRWKLGPDTLLLGRYYDYYKPLDAVASSQIDSIREKVMSFLGNIPGVSGLFNGLNDGVKDVVKGFYQAGKDLGAGNPDSMVTDLFNTCKNVVEDVAKDFEYSFIKIAEEILKLNCHLSTNPPPNCDYVIMQRDLYNHLADFRAKYPRKKYHISLQQDFFGLVSLQESNALHIFQKDKSARGKWVHNVEAVQTTSQHFSIQSGKEFISVLDEMSDALYIYGRNGPSWQPSLFWLDMNDSKDVSSGTNTLQMAKKHARYRSTHTSVNNLIIATVKSAKVSDGVKVYLIYHDEAMKWHVNAEKVKVDRGLTGNAEHIHDALFGFDGNMVLKAAPSFAVLQCYNHLDSKISETISDIETAVPPLFIGKMLLGGLIDDFVPDYRKVNSTFGLTWDESYQNIRMVLLHSGVGQTDISVRIDGNTINKVGRAHSLIVGHNNAMFPENGQNYAFRYDGSIFLKQQFPSKYSTGAFGPDLGSVVESDGAGYKQPKFYRFNPNEIKHVPVVSNPNLQKALENIVNIGDPSSDLMPYLRDQLRPALDGDNPRASDDWILIDAASGQRIPTTEEIDEIITVTADVINIGVQVALLLVPGAGEVDAAGEAALSAGETLGKVAKAVGNVSAVAQPMANELASALTNANPFTTSIVNDMITVNGISYTRNPDETWTQLTQTAVDKSDGNLVGQTNRVLPGYYPFTQRNGKQITNKVALYQNGQLNKVIVLAGAPYNNQIVHEDSLTQVAGPNVFVSYGPLDKEKIGFVAPNPYRRKFQVPAAATREERSRHASYRDARTVRLHKVTQGDVIGGLSDYVVTQIGVNAGNRTYSTRYSYYTPQYTSSSRNAVYAKVTEEACAGCSSPNELGSQGGMGSVNHYFSNEFSYSLNSISTGYATQFVMPDRNIIHSENAIGFSQGGQTVLGVPYATKMVDESGKVIAQNLSLYSVWALNLTSGATYRPTNLIKLAGSISTLDSVVSITETHYRQSPIERDPLVVDRVTTYETNHNGETRKNIDEYTYACEVYPTMAQENRLSERATVLKKAVVGSEQPIVLGCNTVSYEKVLLNGDSIFMPMAHYAAKDRDGIALDRFHDYAFDAAGNTREQDQAIVLFEGRLAAIERFKGHYTEAHLAALAAKRKALDSHKQIGTMRNEMVAMSDGIPIAQKHLNKVIIEEQELLDSLDAIEYRIASETSKIESLDERIRDKDAEIANVQREIDDLRKVFDDFKRRWKNGNTAERVVLSLQYPSMVTAEFIMDLTVFKDLEEDKQGHINARTSLVGQKNGYSGNIRTLRADSARDQRSLNDLKIREGEVLAYRESLQRELDDANRLFDNAIKATNRLNKLSDDAIKKSTSALHNDTHGSPNVEAHSKASSQHQHYQEKHPGHVTKVKNLLNHVNRSRWRRLGKIDSIPTSYMQWCDNHAQNMANLGNLHDRLGDHGDTLKDLYKNRPKGFKASWVEQSRVLSYNPNYGVKASWENARNTSSSILFDKNGRNTVFQITNADVNRNEAFSSGFEKYESHRLNIRGNITSKYAHTGSQSTLIGTQQQIQLEDFKPRDGLFPSDSLYLFSAWIKKRSWMRRSRLKGSHMDGEAFKTKVKGEDGWTYFEYKFRPSEGFDPKLQLFGKQLYIDDVAIRPLNSKSASYVFDAKDRVTAILSANGQVTRTIYNENGEALVQYDNTGTSASFVLHNYAREAGDTDHINRLLRITFRNGCEAMKQNWLGKYVTEQFDPVSNDLALFMEFERGDSLGFSVEVNGGILKVVKGNLEYNGNHLASVTSSMLQWIVLIVGDQLCIFSEGKRIAQQTIKQTTKEPGSISCSAKHVRYMVLGREPVITADFMDGLGRIVQKQHLEFDKNEQLVGRVITGYVYDGWGNQIVKTLPVFHPSINLTYFPELITSFNGETGELNGYISEYFDEAPSHLKKLKEGDEKFAYYRSVFEPNFMHRPVSQLPPGKRFSQMGKEEVTRQTYSSRSIPNRDSAWLKEIRIHERITHLPGNRNKTVTTNETGRLVGQGAGRSNQSTEHGFTKENFPITTVHQPNYIASGQGNAAYTHSLRYFDLLGLSSAYFDTDLGTTSTIRNYLGYETFSWLSENDGPNEPVSIEYLKYDELHQLREKGSYETKLDRDLLETMANSSFWDDEGVLPHTEWRYNLGKDGQTQNYQGRLAYSATIVDENLVETRYTYDRAGNVTEITQYVELDDNRTDKSLVRYDYNPGGRVTGILYPNGVRVVYTYDKLGRLKGVGDAQNKNKYATYAYAFDGKLIRTGLNNNTLEKLHFYNLQGQLASIVVKKEGKVVYKTEFEHNEPGKPYLMGRIESIEESGAWIRSNVSRNLVYDDQYRITEVKENEITCSFSYDLNGNMTQYNGVDGIASEYRYVDGRNLRESNEEDNGQITKTQTTKGTIELKYDPILRTPKELQLDEKRQRVSAAALVYDASGKRIARAFKQRGLPSTYYFFGTQSQAIVEKQEDGKNKANRNLIYGLGHAPICSQHADGKTYFHIRNYQESLRFVLGAGNKPIVAYQYDIHGKLKDKQRSGHELFETFTHLYTGQEYDHYFGVYNFHARLYNPHEKQFLSTDEVYSGYSPYVFANNDPVNYVDPDGRTAFDFSRITKAVQLSRWKNIEQELKGLSKTGRVSHFEDILTKSHRGFESQERFVATFNHMGKYRKEINEAMGNVHSKVATKLRPGSTHTHEMLPVSTVVHLHKLGLEIEEIQEWTVPTDLTTFLDRQGGAWEHPGVRVSNGKRRRIYANKGETEAHNEMIAIVQKSQTARDAIQGITDWSTGNAVNGTSYQYYMDQTTRSNLGTAPAMGRKRKLIK